MKRVYWKFFVTACLVVLGLVTRSVSAVSPTPTPSGILIPDKASTTSSDTTKKIEDLKERLATKVTQLRQQERRAVFGTVKSTSISTFTVETKTKDVKIELTDDMKVIQYLKGKRTVLSSDDIEKGDTVVVFGVYDTTLDLLKGSVVFIQNAIPTRVWGLVTSVDREEFTMTVASVTNQTYVVDIEKSTKAFWWDKDKKAIAKSGFSKITVGDTVHIIGTPVPKKEQRVSADRILSIGNITGAPTAQPTSPPASPQPTQTREASGGASPTATKKPTLTPTKKPTVTPTP